MVRRFDFAARPVRLTFCAMMGFLYGLIISRIPAPADPKILPAGYFVAPWLVLPFLAGRLQRSASLAGTAGALTAVLCMFGFYLNAFPEYHPAYIALRETATGFELMLGSAVLWFTVNAMWYIIAAIAGLVFGLLGHVWLIARSPVPLFVLGVSFILEPLAHTLLERSVPRPYVVWMLEVAAGSALPVWAVFARQRRRASLA